MTLLQSGSTGILSAEERAGPSTPPGSGFLPLVVPNVFIAHECNRTETPISAISTNINETYAEGGEDLIVESLLSARFIAAGRQLSSIFYIEVGARHPVQSSNTYLFYRKYNASGVLIAENRDLIPALQRVRPRDIVVQNQMLRPNGSMVPSVQCPSDRHSALMPAQLERFDAGTAGSDSVASASDVSGLLERFRISQIDMLSINTDGRISDIGGTMDFTRFHPTVIQWKPNDPSEPGTTRRLVAMLKERGYALAAHTLFNLIFVETVSMDAGASLPAVNSFDIFDTLIARRCIDPARVFVAVEQATGVKGFASVRAEAEMAVSRPGMTLDDIHAEVGRRLALKAAAIASLKQAEIDAELAQVIPVSENLARVKDGDLLLSDMYLPSDVIRTLLTKAGLDRQVGLVVSTDGKQSGRIWPTVLTCFTIGRHLGDNPLSDVKVPQRFGIAAERTLLSEPTQIERWFLDVGLRAIGEYMRAARLRIATADPLARRLLLLQTQFNFPILLLSSLLLHQHGKAIGARRLLFASRDCHLWQELYATLFPEGPITEYFYTSRRVRVQPSAGYRAYALERLDKGSVIVDLCGSGWSSARLMETLKLRDRTLFFLHQVPRIMLYEQHPTPDICQITAIVGPAIKELDHVRLEMCNYALHGSVVDVREVSGVAIPVFDVDTRSDIERSLVSQQVSCFRSMITGASAGLLREALQFGTPDIVEVVGRLYGLLSKETCFQTAFGVAHQREDLYTQSALRLGGERADEVIVTPG